MNKPEIVIPKQPKIDVTVDYAKSIIQEEKDELNEMKKIRDETGIPLSRLIELKKRGYKIVKTISCKENCKCH